MITTKFREELMASEWGPVNLRQGFLEERLDRRVVWGIDTDGQPRIVIVIRKGNDVIGELVDDNPLARDPVYGFRSFRLASELTLLNDNSLSSVFMSTVHLLAREAKAVEASPEHAERTKSFFEAFTTSGIIDASEVDRIAVQLPINVADLAVRLSSADALVLYGMTNEVDQGRLQLTSELKRLGVASTAVLQARKSRLEGQSARYAKLFEEYLQSRGVSGCACCAQMFIDNMVQGLARGLEGAALVASSIVRYHKQHNVAAKLESIKQQLEGPAMVLVIGGHGDEDEQPFDQPKTINAVAAWVGPKMSTKPADLVKELTSLLANWNKMPIVVE